MKRTSDIPEHPNNKRTLTETSNTEATLTPTVDMATDDQPQQQPEFFKPIGEHVSDQQQQDGEPQMVQEIESLCMDCHKNGTTRMLLTSIPYFREVIVVSFHCDHCGNRNNEIQSAGEIQPKGCIYTVHITTPEDLNRQVVKSEWCTVSIPELQIEIPPKKGQLTTIEGIVSDTMRDLELDQPVRKHTAPEAYAKIEEICTRLRDILGEEKEDPLAVDNEQDVAAGSMRSRGPVGGSSSAMSPEDKANRKFAPFSIRLDDPSGNSFVEFLGAVEGRGMSDAKWSKRDYPRTKEQNEMLGLAGNAGAEAAAAGTADPEQGGGFSKESGETDFENEEIFTFDGVCSSCSAALETRMKKVNIPYFKDILIMSTNCPACGYKDNEVKSGAAISAQGRKLTLRVEDTEDLSRDVLKSETAGLAIPEIDLHLNPGTLGGRFTTLEGLLQQVYDELSERVLMRGDSSRSVDAANFEAFLGRLKSAIAVSEPYTVILDDPLANSYIQNPYAPDPDEQLTIENYDRSFEQNEDLGLNDIKVENYNDEIIDA